MAAASKRGMAGTLRSSELVSLLRCANASAGITRKRMLEILASAAQESEHLLPQWLRSAEEGLQSGRNKLLLARNDSGLHRGNRQLLLGVRQISGLLIRLNTASKEIDALFNTYATSHLMCQEEWMQFYREEQLSDAEEIDTSPELELAQATFDKASKSFEQMMPADNQGLSVLSFAQQLLCRHNDAVAPPKKHSLNKDQPFAHYWTATSHKYADCSQTQD